MAHGIREASHLCLVLYLSSLMTLDYIVRSKHCTGCSHREARNHDSDSGGFRGGRGGANEPPFDSDFAVKVF